MSNELEKLNIRIQNIRNEEVVTGIPVVSEISLPPEDWDVIADQLKKKRIFINTDPSLEVETFKYNGMIVRRGEKEKETPEEEKPSE